MFKWGLFKKDLADTDLPDDLKKQMQALYSNFSGSDRVVLVMDELRQIISDQKSEIEALHKNTNELQQKLEQSYRAKNFQADLLTSMCDEIQAPIHTMNQLGDWLDQTHLDPGQKAGFNFYRITGRKLNDLFKNIIDVAKLREGVFQLDPISFQLSEVVREIMQTLNLIAQEKGVSLTVQVDPDVPPYLVGDVKRLEQILISLVNNAIKFTYEGEVQVRVQKGKEKGSECGITFLVMDSGMGIPGNQLQTIFERLAQGDPDVERNYGGTGLGLFICKCLVEQMGGTIWAENRKEGGATFGFDVQFEKGSLEEVEEELLYLPDTADAAPEPAEDMPEHETPEPEEFAENNGAHETQKILVADDCEETCKMIEKILEDTPYDVEVAHDGIAALEKYDSVKYDLILMDIQMPGIDGVGATMEIRDQESKGAAKTPIFALVEDASEEDGYYLAADFDRCINKPISKEDLLEAIDTLNPR